MDNTRVDAAQAGGETRALELRVHGVSGTPPDSLLDRPLVTQVAGDAIAGFYRPRLPAERTDDGPGPFGSRVGDGPELEGYCWGGLTSGSPGRALWLLLLPFTLANIAPRARPLPQHDSPLLSGLIWVFSRWLALGLTLLLTVTAGGLSLGLVGWQCPRSDACVGARGNAVFGFVFGGTTGAPTGGRFSPEWTLVVTAAIPLLMLAALWWVSKRTIDRYESVTTVATPVDDHEKGPEVPLSSSWMWRNEGPVRRLRAAHLQSGVACVLWLGASTASPRSLLAMAAPNHWGEGWPALVAVLCLAVWVYALVVLTLPSYVEHGRSVTWWRVSLGVWAALAVAGVVTVADLLTSGVDPAYGAPNGVATPLPGFDELLGVIVIGTFATLAAVIGTTIALAGKEPAAPPEGADQQPLDRGLRGLTTAALATAAVLVAAVFSASAYTLTAGWLHSGSWHPGPGAVSAAIKAFAVPDAFRMATFVFAVSVLLAVPVVVVAVGLFLRRVVWPQGAWRDGAFTADYPDLPAGDDPPRTRAIKRAFFLGGVVEQLIRVVFVLACAGVVLTLLGGAVLVMDRLGTGGDTVADFMRRLRSDGPDGLAGWEGYGAFADALSLLGLISIASLAFRVPTTRRVVGIVWDVASFWPRACHPLAAPCYAERTVPDLVTRLDSHLTTADRPVVLAAHSQGTVLSMASLLYLHRAKASTGIGRLSLVTFGCVLRRLYARHFPVYFGVAALDRLQRALTDDRSEQPRWLNLWRYTDYLGGQVTAGPPCQVPDGGGQPVDGLTGIRSGPTAWEWHSADPAAFGRSAGDTTFPAPSRHSNFWRDTSGIMQHAVARVIEMSKDPGPES